MKRIVLIALSCSLFFAACAGAQSVTRGTFVVIQKVQELMSEERYEEAIVELEALVIKVADNPYDFALANQYLAHTSVLMDNSARARSALEAALGNPDIPQEIRTSMNLFYGTIMLGQEEFELALNALEEWFSLATVPQPGQIFSLAYANYRNDNVPRAEELVARAIDDSPDPQNTWYQLYYRVLFEQKKYEQAEVVLKGIITREPKEESNWRLLASHYLQIEDSREGLAAMMIAYINEFLETNSDLKQIVSLWGYIDAPEKGARLLEEWLDSGKLETDAESLKQLGNLLVSRRSLRRTARPTSCWAEYISKTSSGLPPTRTTRMRWTRVNSKSQVGCHCWPALPRIAPAIMRTRNERSRLRRKTKSLPRRPKVSCANCARRFA
jgi:tetratricopeptide (TPR) repeat protein